MTAPSVPPAPPRALPDTHPLLVAFALALGAAVALGFARFAYALLLPPMRADLGWTYLTAGAMNTANALGYLVGALSAPRLMARWRVGDVFVAGAWLTAALMAASGATADTGALFGLRIAAGAASAWVFVGGGVLAAQLGARHPRRAGLLLGIYYGGTGLGIMASSALVPLLIDAAQAASRPHGWQWAWFALGAACAGCAALMSVPARSLPAAAPPAAGHRPPALRRYGAVLAGYFMFGVGYIGYMTFVVALLRQLGVGALALHLFYALLGAAVLASSRLWARMLDRFRGGESLAILNALLAFASLLPAVIALVGGPLDTAGMVAVFGSGLLFGGVFLSAVASTTAFVRHNLPQTDWVAGITAFTIIFAIGQILGPTAVGWIADAAGGLAVGLLWSAGALLLGALLAWRQRPLT